MKKVQVPSLWRIMRCGKHKDYEATCLTCQEEVLTVKTEAAYRSGFVAGKKAAAVRA